MFDTCKIGKRIASLRKQKNLTQTELADRMGVSFQAVSNWERGNSMPDIGKLPDLTRALECTIDELLGNDASARLVEHLSDGTEADYIKSQVVDAATVADVAPIVPPATAERLCESVKEELPEGFDVASIAALAPFLSEEYLHTLVLSLPATVSASECAAIAPFLSDASLEVLAERAVAKDFSELAAIAPFLSDNTLEHIAENVSPKNLSEVASVAPFLTEAALSKIVMRAVEGGSTADVAALAPFLSNRTIEAVVDVLMQRGDKRALCALTPFL